MKVIIAGTRSFNDFDLLCRKCDHLLQRYQPGDLTIVSGGAHGADTLGEWYAHQRKIPVEKYPADWKQHGKAAGHIRNRQMAEVADCAIVFWDGESRGSKNMIETMKQLGKPVRIVKYQDQEF
jgi:hypothetical protein